ncbi:MAG: NUDIX domain-containing protein [Halobacteriovoraceae bacterium]|nr:NUDIX domain-containing protein [Halobacteriovoraceae bacterium]
MKHTSDALVFCDKGENLKILLIKRKNNPYKNFWALPGGFLEEGENPHTACLRELEEETQLNLNQEGYPLSLRQRIGRDPRGEVKSYPFMFHIENEVPVIAQDDAKEVKWIRILDFPSLAFDHEEIICEGLGCLFNLFKEKFSRNLLPSCFYPFSLDPMKEVVFFGGSFNPWHEGHAEAIRQINEKHKIPVVIVPDFNPWKKRNQLSSFLILKEIISKNSDKNIFIFPGFIGIENENPTIDWISKLDLTKISLLIGEDNLERFHLWKNYKLVLNKIEKLYVLPRAHCKKQSNELILRKVKFLDKHLYEEISSSKIREKTNN